MSARFNGTQIVWKMDVDAAECYRDILADYLAEHKDVGIQDDLRDLLEALEDAYQFEAWVDT